MNVNEKCRLFSITWMRKSFSLKFNFCAPYYAFHFLNCMIDCKIDETKFLLFGISIALIKQGPIKECCNGIMLQEAINKAAKDWGLECLRYEISMWLLANVQWYVILFMYADLLKFLLFILLQGIYRLLGG